VTELLSSSPANRDDFTRLIAAEEPVRQKIQSMMDSISTRPASMTMYLNEERLLDLSFVQVDLEQRPFDVAVVRDVSYELGRRKEMARLSRLATLGQIAAGAAHEFNNNLTSVLGWAQIARQSTDDESPAFSALKIIEESARKAKRIFSRLLDTSRSADSAGEVRKVSPSKIVDDVLMLLHFEMKHAQIEVVRSFQETGRCSVDPDAIGQVLINIIRNAIDAFDGGGVLTARVSQKGGTILIDLQDDGPGMTKEVLGRVFEPFYSTKLRDDTSTNGGTGLGLTISLDIIRQHGGDIKVESTHGEGTCFTVSLPVADETANEPVKKRDSRPTVPPGAVVLVVDDEPDVGEMIRTSLELQGVSVLSVSSGDEAVDECRRLRFDAAFVDYSMPGLSGHDLGEKMLSVQPSLPIIFMSGLTVEKNSVAAEFLKKPFDLDEIAQKLYKVLKRRKQSKEQHKDTEPR
jgi:signal transduction histidine kinase/CheY-like chemotaxis protein